MSHQVFGLCWTIPTLTSDTYNVEARINCKESNITSFIQNPLVWCKGLVVIQKRGWNIKYYDDHSHFHSRYLAIYWFSAYILKILYASCCSFEIYFKIKHLRLTHADKVWTPSCKSSRRSRLHNNKLNNLNIHFKFKRCTRYVRWKKNGQILRGIN